MSKSFNNYSHSNIRYGIIMAPLFFLLIAIGIAKNKIIGAIIILLFCFQLYTNFFTPLLLQFSFPVSWNYAILTPVPWFVKHYDGGLILISANRHENFMFQTNLSYSGFIYEGSRNYWITSLTNPAKYATWVIYDDSIEGDAVQQFLTEHAHYILDTQFELVYNKSGTKIYRKKP